MSKQLPQLLTDFIYAINEHGQVDFNSITVNDSDPKCHVYQFVIWVPDSPNSIIGMKYEVFNQTREGTPEEYIGWNWRQISVVGRKYRN